MSGFCDEMERFGKGIGSPSRFRIMQELFKGPRTVGGLVSATKQSQPCVSQHLKTLKLANLVVDTRHGKEVIYAMNSEYVLGVLRKLSEEVRVPNGLRGRAGPHGRSGKGPHKNIK